MYLHVSSSLFPLMAIFPSGPGLASSRMSPFWILLELRMATQSGFGDSSMTCAEQNSLADTRGNGYVADKLRMMVIRMMEFVVMAGAIRCAKLQ